MSSIAERPAEIATLSALADPTRWQVLSLLATSPDQTATTLAGRLPVSRVAIVKHLGVLEKAGLVGRERRGREVRFQARPKRLESTARWMAGIAIEWDVRLAAIKRIAEGGD